MPAVDLNILTSLLTIRQDIATSDLGNGSTNIPDNTASLGVRVVCAWPVSGQYGFGTRILYYVLVGTCVVARKMDWLRNACLAAALLFPVTAAVHGIVLAAVHVDGAVDMDIYGALQLCAIGVLVAPVSVRLSSTYNKSAGRNLIFAWSAIILAGLISLVVEFSRTDPARCEQDYNGIPMTSSSQFPYYNSSFTCGLICTEDSTQSPIRLGSSNNIYVIPAPTVLTFNSAMLIAAGACIPAILLPASLFRENYKTKHRPSSPEESTPERGSLEVEQIEQVRTTETEPSTDPTDAREKKIRKAFQKWPLGIIFVVVVFAMLAVGEANLWSPPVYWQTDYMANVGQWAPLVGTGLAIVGSMYLLLAQAMSEERPAEEKRRQQAQEEEERHPRVGEEEKSRRASARRESPSPKQVRHAVRSLEKTAPSAWITTASEKGFRHDPGNYILHVVALAFVKVGMNLAEWSADSIDGIRDATRYAQDHYPETPAEAERNINISRLRTYSSTSHSGSAVRPRTDTMRSSRSQSGVGQSGSEMTRGPKGRRDTLDVDAPRRSTQNTIHTIPTEVHLPDSNGPNTPEIVISHDDT